MSMSSGGSCSTVVHLFAGRPWLAAVAAIAGLMYLGSNVPQPLSEVAANTVQSFVQNGGDQQQPDTFMNFVRAESAYAQLGQFTISDESIAAQLGPYDQCKTTSVSDVRRDPALLQAVTQAHWQSLMRSESGAERARSKLLGGEGDHVGRRPWVPQ